MHIEVDRQTEAAKLAELEAGVAKVLTTCVRRCEDWKPMQARMLDVISRLESARSGVPHEELAEGRAFLAWLLNHHFTFLGCRDYEMATVKGDDVLRIVPGSGTRHPARAPGETLSTSFATLPPEARKRARVRELLVLTKANARSTVHRPGHLDYVGVKHFDANGEVRGETRFLGLYTHTAYAENPREIPLVRRKLAQVEERAGLLPAGYSGKALASILENYPRDELLQISAEDLYRHATAILQLGERQRLRLLTRQDAYGRFVTCLIYVPRERYNTELRQRFQKILTEAFNGVSSDFDVDLSSAPAGPNRDAHPHARPARWRVRRISGRSSAASRDDAALGRRPLRRPPRPPRRSARERAVPHLRQRLPRGLPGGILGRGGGRRYRDARSVRSDGRSRHEPVRARRAKPGRLNFKIYRRGSAVPLSESVPLLERLGVRVQYEHPHLVAPKAARQREWSTSGSWHPPG